MSDPVVLPRRYSHGGSTAYSKYRCRCPRCLSWRRRYDRQRYRSVSKGVAKARRLQPGGWYVCLNLWGDRYSAHDYTSFTGICIRCKASRLTEELWERNWNS